MDDGRVSDRRISYLTTCFRRWLDRFDMESDTALAEMGTLSKDEVRALIAAMPDLFGRRTVRLLLERAKALIGDSPRKAADVCRVAIKIADELWSETPDEDIGMVGDAWRELASALHSAGEWVEAEERAGAPSCITA